MPRMPHGKPAGVRCAHLTDALECDLYGTDARPAVCASLTPTAEMCGESPREAIAWLGALEQATRPR